MAEGCAGDGAAGKPTDPLVLDDASGVSATKVRRHWRPRADEQDLLERMRRELKAAAAEGRPVCIGGARHSMGGQSLVADGVAITLDRGRCDPDVASATYRAAAGARWRDVIAALDPVGFVPKVMQSNNDFTLGGAYSVNVHGWAVPQGPMGSTVQSVTIMLPSGDLTRCSRTSEPALFGLAMGGYGAFGVILELEVEMTRNVRLAPGFSRMTASEIGPAFAKAVRGPGVAMAYGRLSVGPDDFLQDAQLVVYRELAGKPDSTLSASPPGLVEDLTRRIYRAQIGSSAAKDFRWYAETQIGPRLQDSPTTRGRLINTSVNELAERDRRRTDILHEYFLPPGRLAGFLADCRRIIPKHGLELLNVTLRFVGADADSVMAFAPTDRVAAVMSFTQPKTAEADAGRIASTQALIDAALAHGGSFYLPYRLHARPDQLRRAYPRLDEFVDAKRRHDPQGLFRSTMWDRYFAPLAS